MNERTPERPQMDDDLVQAYARARALVGASDGPPAAVRANVLAAAQAVAAEAAARRAAEAVAPAPFVPLAVAPPVAEVGRGRPRAVNLASWRVRAGAALCAAALVAVVGWRLEALRRDDAVQVAAATRSVEAQVAADVPPPPKDLAPPAPAVAVPAPSAAAPAPRDRDLVVAQADQPYRAQGARRSAPAERAARRDAAPEGAAKRADEAPVVLAAAAPPAPAPVAAAPPVATLDSAAAAPADLAAAPAGLAAAPVASTADERTAAAKAEAAAMPAPVALAKARSGPVVAAAARQAAPAATGAPLHATPPPLQAAADRGDVDALKTLLAAPGVRIDTPDADGRTALLHAVLAQQPEAVRLLLAAGADPGRADHAGLTPRQAARSGASAEIAALLAAPR